MSGGLIDEIFRVFREQGAGAYLGEPVSMTEHMLQSAYAAERDDAPPRLVAAALLHDYGHFIHELPEDAAEHGIDTQHEEVAHAFLLLHDPGIVFFSGPAAYPQTCRDPVQDGRGPDIARFLNK